MMTVKLAAKVRDGATTTVSLVPRGVRFRAVARAPFRGPL